MKAVVAILLFIFPVIAFCQSSEGSQPTSNTLLFSNRSLHNFHLQTTPLPASLQFSNQLIIPASTVPERLPMFCALEKKLKETCNVWIKIRLPERP